MQQVNINKCNNYKLLYTFLLEIYFVNILLSKTKIYLIFNIKSHLKFSLSNIFDTKQAIHSKSMKKCFYI